MFLEKGIGTFTIGIKLIHEIGVRKDGYKQGRLFSHVVAVCDEATQQCPIFPGTRSVVSWSFIDPSTFVGSDEEIMEQVRVICDAIEQKVKTFLAESPTKKPL
jgi:arsenate reductase